MDLDGLNEVCARHAVGLQAALQHYHINADAGVLLLLTGSAFTTQTACPRVEASVGMYAVYKATCNPSRTYLCQVLLPATREQGIEVASGNTGQGGHSGRKLAATDVKLDYTGWIGAVQVRKVRGFLHHRTSHSHCCCDVEEVASRGLVHVKASECDPRGDMQQVALFRESVTRPLVTLSGCRFRTPHCLIKRFKKPFRNI